MSEKKPYVKMPIGDDKLALFGEPWSPDDWKRKPIARWRLYNNNIQFSSFLNHPSEDEKTIVRYASVKKLSQVPAEARLSRLAFRRLVNELRKCINSPETSRFVMSNRGYEMDSTGNRAEETSFVSKIAVGRDTDGIIYISLAVTDRPIPEFKFKADYWHSAKLNGDEITTADESSALATAWLYEVEQSMTLTQHDNFVPDVREQLEAARLKREGQAKPKTETSTSW